MKNQRRNEEVVTDCHTAEDIEKRIGTLASSYVPEWHFDRENPDIGGTIARIFAGQMEGNIQRYHQVLDKYHTEFVNMLGISLLPAKPASTVVLMNLVQNTIPGAEIPRGTKLLADGDEGSGQLVFETDHSLYVTSSALTAAFMTDPEDGRIVPLLGKFEIPSYLPEQDSDAAIETEENREEEEAEESTDRLEPFRLFGRAQKGIEKNILLFYHSSALDVENDNIYVRMEGCPKLMDKIRSGRYVFSYYSDEGVIPLPDPEFLPDGNTLVIRKEKENKKVRLDGREYSLLILEAKEPVKESFPVERFCVSSSGRPVPAEFVTNGSTELDVETFEPFGDTLSLFQECYIGEKVSFGKSGAVIRLSFDVTYGENHLGITVQQEDAELKIIKRKPRAIWTDSAAEVYAEEIALEYFNGLGWKKLPCRQEHRNMFAETRAGKYVIEFVCPEDWAESGAGAYYGRCLRLQLLKSSNCYMRPAVHHPPKIQNLRISFSYEERYMDAERLISIAGTRKVDLTGKVKEGEMFQAFTRGQYSMDSLYLGFDRKMEAGPISILFQLDDSLRFEGQKCRFEYSSASGFKQTKALDYTADLSHSGIILFMPPPDMQPLNLEGKKAYWLRISRLPQYEKPADNSLPIVNGISLNAVQVSNIETREEEDYYLDEVRPGMSVELGVSDILDVELWVNEKGTLSRREMQRLMKESPDDVRVGYDMLGEISSFFVRWEETDQLSDPPHKRCFSLDRMNSRIYFGDGIQTEIPRVLDDVAFTVIIRRCSGRKGNVEPHAIHEAFGNLMFVDQIYNPIRAYGGSSMESLHNALRRGANILKSRKRLVTADDYMREILAYSDTIDKVCCITGRTIEGKKDDNAVNFVILLKDYENGSYSFHNMSGNLKAHLMEACELTIAPKDLRLVEPVFVEISVDVWAEAIRMDDGFEIQILLEDCLKRYLNPIGDGEESGWEIGSVPKKSQLLMKMNVLKNRAIIKKMLATAVYTDESGTHEVDLEDLKVSPFMVCRSGNHRVHILVSEK